MYLRKLFMFAIAFAAIALVASVDCQVLNYSGGRNARALVTQPIDEARLAMLRGNTHPEANAENDRGRVEDSFPMEHMQLVLQRPAELEKALDAFMQEQQRKGSPEYHHWLSAKEFANRYGVAPADIEKVTSWLQNHGFRVDNVLPSGMAIEFSGTAGQVKQAFHTEIHNLDVEGEPHFANMSDPQIPAALTGVVAGVHALHNFMPHSLMKKHSDFTMVDGSYTYYAVVPADLATIYNINPAYSNGITGAGQEIVVIEDTLLANTSDVATFRSAFGLSGYTGTFNQITATGTTTCNNSGVNGDEGEAALDAEWAGASAPDATVVLASCADTTTVFGGLIALQNLINGAAPPQIVSISYGECESENGATANASYKNTYQQAAALGVSVFVSSGDEGAASCDANRTVATHGIAVSGFTSTPYNVSVGGTDFGDLYANLQTGGPALSTYWSASNTTSDGSALSYVPEIPWNDSCASELIYTTNLQTQGTFTQSYGSTGFCNSTIGKEYYRTTGSGSGGRSAYELNKPSWQSVLGNPSDSTRDIPDVSLFAANGVWNHFLLYCLSDAAEGGTPCNYASSNYTNVLNDLAAGGTSFSSPIMAGIQALINQNAGAAQGNPNPRYYALGDIEYGTSGSAVCNSSLGAGIGSTCVFNDVTLGDIDVNCRGTASSSENCYGYTGTNSAAIQGALSTSTSALSIAYGTNSGWDFATGLGTVNAWNMIQDWTSVATTTSVSTSLTPSPFGQSVTFTATITPGIGNTETGTVSWSSNTGCAASTVSAGVATCTTTVLPVGMDTVTASYSGDSNYSASSNSISEAIQPVATITVGTWPSGPSFTVDGTSYSSTQSFTWVVGSTHSLSTTASQFGTGTQYTFTGWSDGTTTVADSITVPSTATTYLASFSLSYLLTIAANNTAYGSVTPAGGSYYASGTSVTITGTPNAGDYFVNWTGSADIASNSSAITSITMNGPKIITGNFAPIPVLVVNTASDDFGSDSSANCAPQITPGTTTTADTCSLRDAADYAFSANAGNITFDSTVFTASNSAAQNTITLSGEEIDIDSANTTITGPTTGSGATLTNLVTVSGGGNVVNFVVSTGAVVAFNNLNIENGTSNSVASGVFNYGGTVAISGSTISGNLAEEGTGSVAFAGGILNYSGVMTIANSTISGNTAEETGAGGQAFGGGITNYYGTLTVVNSTISGNSSINTGSGQAYGAGILSSGTLTVTNSTISGNTITDGGNGVGGGILNYGPMTITGSTITLNTADGSGGGIYDGTTGGLNTVANSIVTGNIAPVSADIYEAGSLIDGGGNQVTTGVALAPLANYGGSTQTQIPLPGDPSICGGLSVNAIGTKDQRGLPFNPLCPAGLVDSGAVQTNYAIVFSTEPASSQGIDLVLTPAPVIELTESGNLFTPAAGPIVMSDLDSVLGGTTSTSTAAGYASFNSLTVSKAESSDTLTATLTLGFISVRPERKPAAKTRLKANVKQAKPELAVTPLNITATSSSFSAARFSQSISFSVTGEQYLNTTIPLTATTTSGLPVGYVSVHPTICTVSGKVGGSWTASLIAVGECSIQAYQWGNASYTSASYVFANFYVHAQPQTISFPAIAVPVYATSSVALSATATSSLAVSFASATPTICTVSETSGAWSANLVAGGRCTIQAKQPGDSTWGAAPVVAQTFTVTRLAQTINFPAVAEPLYVGNQVTPTTTTATSGLPVSYVSVHPTVCTVTHETLGWVIQLIAVGECSVEAQQGGNSIYAGAPVVFQNFYVHPAI
jgi:hypothetical protein